MSSPIGNISKKRPHSEDGDQNLRKLKIAKTNNFICWKISEWSFEKFKAKIEKYGCDFLLEQFKMCHHEKNNSPENVEKFQSILRNIRQCGQVDLQSKVQSFFTKLITEQKSEKLNFESNSVVDTLDQTSSIESLLNKLKNSQSLEDRLTALKELKLFSSNEETANTLMETEFVNIIKDLIIDDQMLDQESHNHLRKKCLKYLINLQKIEGMSIRLHENVHFSKIITWSLAQMKNNNTSLPLFQICCLVSNMTPLQGDVVKSIVAKGGIKAFINCLNTQDVNVLREALRGLAYIPYNEELANKMALHGMVQIFMGYIHHSDKLICQHICGAIAYLSTFGQAKAIVEACGIPSLLKLINSDVPKIQESALGAIANLIGKQYSELVYQEGALDLLIDLVEKGNLKTLQKQQALRCLSYMTCLESAAKEMLEKGVIGLFIPNLSSTDLKTVQFTTFGLYQFLASPNKEIAEQSAKYVVNNGGIEAIIELANEKDFYVRKNVAWSLKCLSLSEQYSHLITPKMIETFLQLIKDSVLTDVSVSGLSLLAQKNPLKFVENGGISAFADLLNNSPTEEIIEEVLRGLESISSTEQSLTALSFNSKLPSLLFSINDDRAKKLIEKFKAQEAMGTLLGSISFEELPLLALNLALLFPEKNPLHAKKGIVKMLMQYHQTAVKEDITIHQLPLPFYCYLMALDNLNSQKTENVKVLKIQRDEEQLPVVETPDLQLVAGEGMQPIDCHRHMLTNASHFFKAMFSVSMKEQDQSVIRLEDISHKNLQTLIDLSYGKTVTFSRRELFDLLSLADRYQMQSIKSSLWECLLEDQIEIGELPEEKAQNLEDFEHVFGLLQDNFEEAKGAELMPFLNWVIRNWKWFKENEEASTSLLNFLPGFNNLI